MNPDDLPECTNVAFVRERLLQIFPEEFPLRDNLITEKAAKVIFVMLYLGAVAETGIRIRPNQIQKMSDAQSAKISNEERVAWRETSMKPGIEHGWFRDREGIRDEVIGTFIQVQAAVDERPDLGTTSPVQRYALKLAFVSLFNSSLKGSELNAEITKWLEEHTRTKAYARMMFTRSSAQNKGKNVVPVEFPDGTRRNMGPGPSSEISKAVIESFAKIFLENPALIHLSESKKKIVNQDQALAERIGLKIDASKALPDIILIDLGPKEPLLVFVECVFSSGEISEKRREDLQKYASEAGFHEGVAFVTAFLDRNSPGYAKVYKTLAWGSFAWFASEPNDLLCMFESVPLTGKRLNDLMK